jgi:uncharacterized repeat protein (TIGR01451 family)
VFAAENHWYVKVDPVGGETNSSDNMGHSVSYIFDPAPVAELSLTKSVSTTTPTEEIELFNYTLKVTNSGPEIANNVIVKDVLPPGVYFDSYKATQGNYFTSGPWLMGNLPANKEAVLTITARINVGFAGQVITNTAEISNSDSIDVKSSDDISSISVLPLPKPPPTPDPNSGIIYLPVIIK